MSDEQQPAAPVQRPADGSDLSQEMRRMQAEADAIVARTERGSDAARAFSLAALQIHRVMRPIFGPANAWLFGERDAKLRALGHKLGLDAEGARQLVDGHAFDSAVSQLEALIGVAGEQGLAIKVRASDRAELMWTPAPGFAVQLTDPSAKVEHKPPYAGTAAGPAVPAVRTHPTVTLFVYPPHPGQARDNMLAREQSGRPVLFAGDLVGYTLHEPQSCDVAPDLVLAKVMPQLARAGLVHRAPADAEKLVRQALAGRVDRVHVQGGLIHVSGKGDPPEQIASLRGCAVLWSVQESSSMTSYLRIMK